MPGLAADLTFGGDVNETSPTSNITSAFTGLALNLASALGTIGIAKLAQGSGAGSAIATGVPQSPVVVVPAGQAQTQASLAAGQTASQISKYVPLLLFGGIAIAGLATFALLARK